MEAKEKTKKINTRVIISVLIGLFALSFILILTTIIVSKNISPNEGTTRRQGSASSNQADEGELGVYKYDSEMLGMILDINRDNKEISLLDINKKEAISLTYSGSTDFRDKFGQIILANQLSIGSIVDIAYVRDENRLVKMETSPKAWEYIGVSNHHIEKDNMTIEIADRKYRYNDKLLVLDQDDIKTIGHLARQDILDIWGIDEVIWSISVRKGHGNLRLEDYEDFLGGNLTVGYEATQQITEDLLLTVREGTYNLTVENDFYSGRKSVTINRNEEAVVSLEGLGPGPMDKGLVTFDVSPIGADLFINNKLTPYVDPVELIYGDYNISASLGGYNSYDGFIKVEKPSLSISIELSEAKSDEDTRVDVGEGEEYNDWGQSSETINENLEEEVYWDPDHYIYVQEPIGASVYLDGEFLGISPGRFAKIIGKHVVTFIKDGHETMSYTVEIADDGLDTYISMPDLNPLQ